MVHTTDTTTAGGGKLSYTVSDDYVIGFKSEQDAKRVMKVLPLRLSKYGLRLHPEKTRLIELDRQTQKGEHVKRTFDFLGFTHYIGKSRKGKRILKRKTSSKKMDTTGETEDISQLLMSETVKWRNRMRESCSYGEQGGNELLYPDADLFTFLRVLCFLACVKHCELSAMSAISKHADSPWFVSHIDY